MPYELFLALRYLRVRRGRHVVRLTALAALAGIACGVAALIVALALANGFRDELRDKILRGTAHVTVMRADGRAIPEPRAAARGLRAVEGVADAAPTTYEGALLTGPAGASYAVLRGVDSQSPRAVEEVRRTLVGGAVEPLFRAAAAGAGGDVTGGHAAAGDSAGGAAGADEGVTDAPPAEIVVGSELGARTGLDRVGAEGWIITGEQTSDPQVFEPRSRRVRVAGVSRSGLYDYDTTWAYLSLEEVASVAGPNLKSSVISVEARDVYAAGPLATALRRALGDGWEVVDWREANRPLFAALELERRTVALIIMLVTLVAALNITTTLVLVVTERRADIAVLAALGAHPRSVMLIFMIEGAAVGAAGALLGVALGLCACAAGDYFELVRLPPDVYSLAAVPFHPRALDVVWPALAAFAVSLVATLYPARQAARVRPAEALRYE